MSKYDKYRIAEIQNSPSNKWEKYRIPTTERQSLSGGDDYPGVIGKSFNKGLLSVLDLPQNVLALGEGAANLPAKAYSAATGNEQPYNLDYFSSLPQLSNQVSKVINKTGYKGFNKPKLDTMGKRLLGGAAETAGSFIGGGIAGKGAQAVGALKTGAALGTPQTAKELRNLGGMGAALGGTSAGLEEVGVDPTIANLTSAIAVPSLTGKLAQAPNLFNRFKDKAKNPLINALGLSPDKLNIKALKAAKASNIELPTAAVTDSALTALGDQYVSKLPYFGDKLKNKYIKTADQTKAQLENLYNAVGPAETETVSNQIANLYKKSTSSLPKDATIYPKNAIKAINDVESKIKTAAPSTEEKALLSELQNIKRTLTPNNIKGIPAEIDLLIGTKRSLNSTIKWEHKDEGVKKLLRKVQKNIVKDISEYGKTNKEWYPHFQEADKFYGQVAKRERLEELLSGRGINAATDDVSYNALSKVIHSPKTAQELKRLTSPEIYNKIQRLGEVAKTLAKKNKNIPNPSGTALTTTALGLIGGIFTSPLSTLATVIGTGKLTKLLTDQKFLDKALKIAEAKKAPNLLDTMALNSRIKEITGVSPIALNKAFSEIQKIERAENSIQKDEDELTALNQLNSMGY